MKKIFLFTVLFIFISLPVFSINYSGGVKASFGQSVLKNRSLNYESDLREALRCELQLEPASFIVSNFDIGIYLQLSYQGDTNIINYTKLIGYTALSLGLSTAYYITDSYTIGLMLGTGYSITNKLMIGSAFLECRLSNSYFITKNVSLSLNCGLIYKKERFEIPFTFSIAYKPFIKEHWYANSTNLINNLFNIMLL